MKKIVLLVMAVLVTASVMADPRDNFKKSGVYIGGSMYGNIDIDNVFNEEEYNKDSYLSAGISPYFGMFVMDNLAFRPRISISTYSSTYWYYNSETDSYIEEQYGSTTLGAGLSAVYYMTDMGEIIPYAGLGGYISRSYSKDGTSNGETYENDYSYEYGYVTLEGGALYFLNDNSALHAGVDISFRNSKAITSSDGETYEYADDYNAMEWVDLDTYFSIGFSYFFPVKSRYIIADL